MIEHVSLSNALVHVLQAAQVMPGDEVTLNTHGRVTFVGDGMAFDFGHIVWNPESGDYSGYPLVRDGHMLVPDPRVPI